MFRYLLIAALFVASAAYAQGAAPGPGATAQQIADYCQKVGDSKPSGEGNNYPGTDNVAWRCSHKEVLVCSMGASGRACSQLNISVIPNDAIRDFCRKNPGSSIVPMAVAGDYAAEWKCQGTNPTITSAMSVDSEGYITAAWSKASASSPPDKEPRAFVEGIYANQQAVAHWQSVLDPDTLALLATNRKLLNGDLGALDYNPLCQCQDSGGLKAAITSLKLMSLTSAVVDIDLRFPGGSRETVKLFLLKEQGPWRVRDIGSKKTASLRDMIQAENKKLAALTGSTPAGAVGPSANASVDADPTRLPPTNVEIQYCFKGTKANGYYATFAIVVPDTSLVDLRSLERVTAVLDNGMNRTIGWCKTASRTNVLGGGSVLDPSDRFSATIRTQDGFNDIAAKRELGSNRWVINSNQVEEAIRRKQQEVAKQQAQHDAALRVQQSTKVEDERTTKERADFLAGSPIAASFPLGRDDMEALMRQVMGPTATCRRDMMEGSICTLSADGINYTVVAGGSYNIAITAQRHMPLSLVSSTVSTAAIRTAGLMEAYGFDRRSILQCADRIPQRSQLKNFKTSLVCEAAVFTVPPNTGISIKFSILPNNAF